MLALDDAVEAMARGMCETTNASPCMCGGAVQMCVWRDQARAALAALAKVAGVEAMDMRWLADGLTFADPHSTTTTKTAALLRVLAAAGEAR